MSNLAPPRPAQLTFPGLQWNRTPWSVRWPRALVAVFVAAIGFLVCYPVVMLLLGSFAPPRGVTNAWFSLDGYRTALLDQDSQRAIVTTIWLALVRATL